jgi:mono/diheme cytochrome c family protein
MNVFGRNLLAVLAFVMSGALFAGVPQPHELTSSTTGLPSLDGKMGKVNPYRGNDAVLVTGQKLFNEGCARCHGMDAVGDRSPAPDLRGLQPYCRPIADAALRSQCEDDVDAYYVKRVLNGKSKVGIIHMPAWEGFLSPEQLWAIKTFIEVQRRQPVLSNTVSATP